MSFKLKLVLLSIIIIISLTTITNVHVYFNTNHYTYKGCGIRIVMHQGICYKQRVVGVLLVLSRNLFSINDDES